MPIFLPIYSANFVLFQGDDPELEAIRQRRMQEIMAQQGGQVRERFCGDSQHALVFCVCAAQALA